VELANFILYPAEGDRTFLRNAVTYIPNYTVSHSRGQYTEHIPLLGQKLIDSVVQYEWAWRLDVMWKISWEVKWSWLILPKGLKTIKFLWRWTVCGVRFGTEVYEILNRCANQLTAIVSENAWSFTFTSRVFKQFYLFNLTHGLVFFVFDVV
jgi:hypothetical protein